MLGASDFSFTSGNRELKVREELFSTIAGMSLADMYVGDSISKLQIQVAT
jgi:hypothetical protein